MLQTCRVAVRCVVGLGPTNFNKHGHRAAACHANFACCGQLLQNFLASPRKSVVSPSRLPRPGVEGNIPTDDLTYILDCDLTYTAPSGDVTLGSHATSCRNRAEPGVSYADLHASSTSSSLSSTSTTDDSSGSIVNDTSLLTYDSHHYQQHPTRYLHRVSEPPFRPPEHSRHHSSSQELFYSPLCSSSLTSSTAFPPTTRLLLAPASLHDQEPTSGPILLQRTPPVRLCSR
jgi:hypothetical protein